MTKLDDTQPPAGPASATTAAAPDAAPGSIGPAATNGVGPDEVPSAAAGLDELHREDPDAPVVPAPEAPAAKKPDPEPAPVPPASAPEPTPADPGHTDGIDDPKEIGPGALAENKHRMSAPPELHLDPPFVEEPRFSAEALDDPERTQIDRQQMLTEQQQFFGVEPNEQLFVARQQTPGGPDGSQDPPAGAIVTKSPEETFDFLRGRQYYVDGDGKVWGVHVDDDQHVSLIRNGVQGDTPQQQFTPTYQPRSAAYEQHVADHPYLETQATTDPATLTSSARQTLSSSGQATVTVLRDRQAAPGVTDRTGTTTYYEEPRITPSGVPSAWSTGTRVERRLTAEDPVQGSVQIDSVKGDAPGVVEATAVTRSSRRGDSVRINDVAEPPVPTTAADLDALHRRLDAINTSVPRLDPREDLAGSASGVFDLAARTERSYDAAAVERAIARSFGPAGGDGGVQRALPMVQATLDQTKQRLRDFGFTDVEQLDGVTIDPFAMAGGLNAANFEPETDTIHLSGRLVDGTGDDRVQLPYALSTDVIAHEFTHRVTDQQLAGFSTSGGYSQAISESLADTIASSMDDDWVIGESMQLGGTRDMSERHTVAELPQGGGTGGTSHEDAQIANTAAHDIGEQVGRDAMGRIYTDVLQNGLHTNMSFQDLARATIDSAVKLYGATSPEAEASRRAWNGVLELAGPNEIR